MVAFFFVPLGVIFTVKGLRGRILCMELFERGVVFTNYRGGQTLLWEDITAVYWEQFSHRTDVALGLEVTTHRTAKLTIVPRFGKHVVVDERFPRHVELAAVIRDAAGEAMLPRHEAALMRGERIFFGPVGIDRWGLHTAQAAYPWEIVAAVRWEPDGPSAWYSVYGTNHARLTTLSASAIPNGIIFQIILERLGKLGASAGADAALGDGLLTAARRLLTRSRVS
ncbi:hypothetical protein AKJ09_04013 [Labilithrix luteola]|uniref:Uncharacterized protein n=1 Tax=Labilithrix luteola TaxID=1391654 RepID=A0A0K1PW32_9BACT|nr:hypothetical protein AKJ09_04013 [Labilithrix luteola]